MKEKQKHFGILVRNSTSLDAIMMEDGSTKYVVKGILDLRVQRGKLQYLVEWKGYEGTDEAVPWERKGNVVGTADEMIEDEARRSE